MNRFLTVWSKIRSLARRRAVKREIDEELRFHIEQRTAENIASGVAPEEAAREARKRFGNLQSIREECRQARGASFGEELVQDVRFGLRMLSKSPGFTMVAVLTLGLGMGVCTAMFSVFDAVLLRALPVHQPNQLVWIENNVVKEGEGGLSDRTSRADHLLAWREQTKTFAGLCGYFAFFDYFRFTLTGAGEPQSFRGVAVTQSFLDVLGVRPVVGRNFSDEECVYNGRPAVILSYGLWHQRFGGDPEIIGKPVAVNGKPTVVVGVLPPRFEFGALFSPGQKVELLMPFPLSQETAGYGNTLFVIGRLQPGATIDQARSEFEVLCQRIQDQHGQRRGWFGARMAMLDDHVRGRFRPAMRILFGAVMCVLLIACVNLSNLLLARANARRREFAVRAALGADRARLARQLITESLLLAMLGCLIGVPLAFAATNVLSNLHTFGIPLLENAAVNENVLAFAVTLSLAAGLLCGLLPALHLARPESSETLNDAGPRSSPGRTTALVGRSLVVAEVAMACMLLVGAALLIRSFIDVLQVNLGFEPRHAVAWRIDPTATFKSANDRVQYHDRLVERVAAVPGIESVGLTDTLPLGRNRTYFVGARGSTYPPGQDPIALPRIVDQGYLQTLRIPLIAGRYFDNRDTPESPNVAVINNTLARRLWPGMNAVGQCLLVSWSKVPEHLVVGVVADVRHGGPEEAAQGEVYLNYRQRTDWPGMELVLRTLRPPDSFVPDVRTAIRQFDPTLASNEFTPLDDIVDRTVAPRRLITGVLTFFSALALLLSAVGLYGVLAYSVNQRTREIGIRMALGAQRGDVLHGILRQGLTLTLAGVVLGMAGALALTRVLSHLLFGVTPRDPMTLMAVAALLAPVALLACWLPARRAASVDPMTALRHE